MAADKEAKIVYREFFGHHFKDAEPCHRLVPHPYFALFVIMFSLLI